MFQVALYCNTSTKFVGSDTVSVIRVPGTISNLGSIVVSTATTPRHPLAVPIPSTLGCDQRLGRILRGSFAQILLYDKRSSPTAVRGVPTNGGFNPASYYVNVNSATLNTRFASSQGGTCTTSTCQVAPSTAPTQIQGISLVNSSWETKFDPYCDSLEGDGKCHCLDGTTGAAKSGNDCTLEDRPTDPTLSSLAVFHIRTDQLTHQHFAAYGGKYPVHNLWTGAARV